MNFTSCPIMSMESSSFWIGINHVGSGHVGAGHVGANHVGTDHVGAGLTCLRRHLCPKGRFLARVVRPHRRPTPTAIDIRYRNSSGRINRFRRSRSMSSETRQGCRYGKVVGVRGMLKLLLYRPVPIHAQGFAVLVGNCHQLGFNDLIRLHDQC